MSVFTQLCNKVRIFTHWWMMWITGTLVLEILSISSNQWFFQPSKINQTWITMVSHWITAAHSQVSLKFDLRKLSNYNIFSNILDNVNQEVNVNKYNFALRTSYCIQFINPSPTSYRKITKLFMALKQNFNHILESLKTMSWEWCLSSSLFTTTDSKIETC